MKNSKVKLCLKNIELAEINLYTGEFNLLSKDVVRMLPLFIRSNPCMDRFKTWLMYRAIPLSRANAKWLLNAMGLPQDRQIIVMVKTRALTLTDAYWLKLQEDDDWDKLNLYNNSFSITLRNIALLGKDSPFSLNDKLDTPEVTTQGAYAKCWNREDDGIYMYKTSFQAFESQAEYISSIIADKLHLNHVHYDLVTYQGRICSKCKDICDENNSIAPMLDYLSYINESPEDITDWISILPKEWHEEFYKMIVFDTLIGNTDRHLSNWGVHIDNNTGSILSLHPLFDHNCAIDIRDNYKFLDSEHSSMSGTTMLNAAQYAYKRLPIEFLSDIDALIDWYYTKEVKRLFKRIYKRLDELNYLKRLSAAVTGREVKRTSIFGFLSS